jgi:hypothetical protein
MNELKARKKLAGGGGGTVVLMIGLYLIILAFFILLNAISESSESNYDKASNSLKMAFGFTSGELEENKEEINISVEEFYDGIARKVNGVLSSYFASDEYEISLREGVMTIKIPTEKFFDGNDVTVNPMVYSFIFDTVEIINHIALGTAIDMDVNIETIKEYDNPARDARSLKRAAYRASDVASIIQQEQPRMQKLNASVILGEEELVKLRVTILIKDYQKALISYRDFLQH